MNKDLKLFTNAINHLVSLTIRDEYGKKKSRGIETYDHLAEELNNEKIVPERGYWTENSLKLFLSRVMNKYPEKIYKEECNLDFIGRRFWEHLSYTKSEEVVGGRTPNKKSSEENDKGIAKKQTAYTAFFSDINSWRNHEKEHIRREDKKTMNDYRNSKNETRISD